MDKLLQSRRWLDDVTDDVTDRVTADPAQPGSDATATTSSRPGAGRTWFLGAGPLLLLVLFIAFLVATDPLARLQAGRPPIEDLTVERVVLATDPLRFSIVLVNGGPDAVTVAQVIVDDAYWTHASRPGPTVGPLGSVTIDVPYPWIDGEPLQLVIVTSTGATVEHRIEVATVTPSLTIGLLLSLAVVGVLVGVVPVAIGLLWLPFVRRLGRNWVGFVLAITIGLLIFLAVDATAEALDIARTIPGAFNGVGILVVGVVCAASGLTAMKLVLASRPGVEPGWRIATLVALGIGLHNLGEGLAIAAAYSVGAAALTTRLVIGFAAHNATEGLAIAAPLGSLRTRDRDIVVLGLLAGAPAILGTWIGALGYSPALAVLFLGLGVGAILQVIWEVGRFLTTRQGVVRPLAVAGIGIGVLTMYLTGLLAG
jgi:ZIP family zinc transporter